MLLANGGRENIFLSESQGRISITSIWTKLGTGRLFETCVVWQAKKSNGTAKEIPSFVPRDSSWPIGGEDFFAAGDKDKGQDGAEVQKVVKPRGGVHERAIHVSSEYNLKISVMADLTSGQN